MVEEKKKLPKPPLPGGIGPGLPKSVPGGKKPLPVGGMPEEGTPSGGTGTPQGESGDGTPGAEG